MRSLAFSLLISCALPLGSMADKPKVTRAMIEQQELNLDKKLRTLWAGDPVPNEVVGLTQGAYINGYGVVFMSEVNLVLAGGITPFHPEITPDELKRTHAMKLQRVAKLKDSMRGLLVDSAASLDSVPLDEQVALGVSLFYWKGENRDGLPSQIVMHAPRKVLLQAKTGKTFDKASIAVDEF